MTEPASEWHEEGYGPMGRENCFTRQENLFLDALEERRQPLCTLDEAIQTLRVNLAALESVRNGARTVYTREI